MHQLTILLLSLPIFLCQPLSYTKHHTKIIQGPSTMTVLRGPDGSVIYAEAIGATILHEHIPSHLQPILNAQLSPVDAVEGPATAVLSKRPVAGIPPLNPQVDSTVFHGYIAAQEHPF